MFSDKIVGIIVTTSLMNLIVLGTEGTFQQHAQIALTMKYFYP